MQPRATLIAYTQIDPDLTLDLPLRAPADLIEFSGRWDYGPKSIAKMGDRDIIRRWISSGEESMVEMVDAAFFIECSRVVSHELVRHRLASFQQESQRYVKYEEEDPDDLFYYPEGHEESEWLWESFYKAHESYIFARKSGTPAQIARYVLPNATRVRMVMKANLREWRHILKLRMHKSAQPEMQIIANQIHDQLLEKFPEVFSDIKPALEAGERQVR